MKTRFTFLAILISTILFMGCSGSKEVPETRDERIVRYLTGAGNKVWRLKEVWVNQVQQTLTDYQMKYTKTYTSNPSNADPLNIKTGTFVNSDGFSGKWTLDGTDLKENYLNNPNGPLPARYAINTITETKLDIEASSATPPLLLVREVYYAN
jgi:hypothetical protein